MVLRGHCSHLAPGVVLMFLSPLPALTFYGSLTWCLHVLGQLEQRVWGSGWRLERGLGRGSSSELSSG